MRARGRSRAAIVWGAGGVLLAALGGAASGAVTMESSAHISPFIFTPAGPPPSADFQAWNANAIQALMLGVPAVGNPAAGPDAYFTVNTVTGRDLFDSVVNSPFPSWRGVADPAPPFNGSYGNGLVFSLHVLGNGTRFRPSNLDNVATSNDPANDYNNFGSHLARGLSNYTPALVGLDYGADRIKGTADDVYYQNGESASVPVDELFYSGVGMAQDVLDPAFGVTPGTHQQDIDRSIDAYFRLHPVTQISNTFTLSDDAGAPLGAATAAVTVVPEPWGFGSVIALAAGSWLRRRRRKPAAVS